MDSLIIRGGKKLSGELKVSASKNACLPILFGTLLSEDKVELISLPSLRDINTSVKLLREMGAVVSGELSALKIDCKNINKTEAPYDLVKTMRASILVLGPLLARFGKAKVSLPGGCAIGGRPVDIHLSNFEKMGASIKLENGYINAKAKKLVGAHLDLSFPSVGATENLMMAAVLAEGETIINNAAKEPEIEDLADFLNSMGANISGQGTSTIKIAGIEKLGSCTHKPIGDRIEAATFVLTGLLTNSSLKVSNFKTKHLSSLFSILKEMGAKMQIEENEVTVFPSELKGVEATTMPYPGFPTDIQAQLMTLMCRANGVSVITEKIFENRFMHVPELIRMGANIKLEGKSAIISGGDEFVSAPVMCTDLRASAALVMAALVAKGESTISRIYHLDRGYENIEIKLGEVGADIKRV